MRENFTQGIEIDTMNHLQYSLSDDQRDFKNKFSSIK